MAKVNAEDAHLVQSLRWHLCTGYARRKVRYGPRSENKTRSIWMHRLIMGEPAGMEVDHINGDKLDNRRSNLRVCTKAENAQNITVGRGSSRHRGVHRRANGRWLAQAGFQGRKHHIGVFDSEDEAAEAARAWRAAHMPFAT